MYSTCIPVQHMVAGLTQLVKISFTNIHKYLKHAQEDKTASGRVCNHGHGWTKKPAALRRLKNSVASALEWLKRVGVQ